VKHIHSIKYLVQLSDVQEEQKPDMITSQNASYVAYTDQARSRRRKLKIIEINQRYRLSQTSHRILYMWEPVGLSK